MRKLFLTFLAAVALIAVGCGEKEGSAASDVAKQEKEKTAKVQEKLRAKVSFPQPDDSLELFNLKRRYELLDEKGKLGFVYLIDHGLVFAEYQVEGKVSSLNSQFTNPLQVIKVDYGEGWEGAVVSQAEPDGSYGENPAGIFFWTTDGVYVEWGGNYQYSDQRLELTQPPQSVLQKRVK